MLIIGPVEDQVPILVWGQISNKVFTISDYFLSSYPVYKNMFEPFLKPFTSNQPLFSLFISVLMSVFGISFYNFFILLTILVNLFISYRFFRFKRFAYPLLYSVIFSINAFLWTHIGTHMILLQLWLYSLFIYLLTKHEKDLRFNNSVKLGFTLALSILISNYNGFFLITFLIAYTIVNLFFKEFRPGAVRNLIICIFVGGALSLMFLFPYVKTVYVLRHQIPVVDIVRPYEDFFTFSSRPWYFILPPVKNPILGEYSRSVLKRLESTNYFLANDYFAGEHQANYFGILFMLSVFLASLFTLAKADTPTKQEIKRYLIIGFGLFSLTFPPFFTIAERVIWTPGYLMYKLFPMFRVTARLSMLILLCLLIILGTSVNFLLKTYPKKRSLILLFICLLTIETLAETYVPLKFTKATNPPEIFTYIKNKTPANAKFAVYPYSKTLEAFFWLPEHKRLLANPYWYKTENFDSESFTKSLASENNWKNLTQFNVNYIAVNRSVKPEDINIFMDIKKFSLDKEFSDYLLFKIKP